MHSLLTIGVLLIASISFAQPANDCPCNAISLTVGDACVNGDNTGSNHNTGGAGCENGVPNCVNGPNHWNHSVWYSFVATDDSITVNFGGGTLGTNLVAEVYSATNCTSGWSCEGNTNSGSEIDVINLNIGETYYIAVDGKNQGQSDNMGTFCISVYETPYVPPIGVCDNPRDMHVGPDCNNISGNQYDEQNNMISTDIATGGDGGASMAGYGNASGLDGGCTGGTSDALQDSYWVRFEALDTDVSFTNEGPETLDYVIYSGDPCSGSATEEACTSIASGGSATINGLTPDSTYYVMITGNGTTNSTQAYLCITKDDNSDPIWEPDNDDCADATVVETSTNYSISNANATVDNNNTLCEGSTENNVWVVWTADYSGTAYVNLQNQDCTAENGMQMSIFEASASCPTSGSLCELYINPNNNLDFYGTFDAVQGSTYYIQFDGYAGAGCEFDFCITSYENPDCETITPLPVELSYFTGSVIDRSVLLEWETISELNSDYFEVEKLIDIVELKWELIGLVPASGFSVNRKKYDLSDLIEGNSEDVIYYRLRQVDFDGTSRTYPSISVDLSQPSKTIVHRVNLMGVEVTENYKGVVILIFKDGTTSKIVQ